MGFVYRVLQILKALWMVMSEAINILRNLHTFFFFLGGGCEFYHRLMYIAPSSDSSLQTHNLT